MYISLTSSFAASWLLLCLMNPLCSRAERSYWVPYEANDPVHRQFRPIQSKAVPFEEQLRSDVPKSSQYDIDYRDYQHNSVQSRIPSKDTYSKVYTKQNVARSIPEYHTGKEYRPDYSEPEYAGNQGTFEKESAESPPQLEQRFKEAQGRDEEIMQKMNVLDKLLSENTDKNDIELKNVVEDIIIAENSIPEETRRVVRQVRRQRPGFFWTLARLAFESFNDTRSAIQQISNVIGQNFAPDTPVPPPVSSNPLMAINLTTSAPSDDQSNLSSNLAGVNVTTTSRTPTTTTTNAPYKFTRTGVQDLLRKNLRGLVRLFNIEWQDALNQSEVSVREFQQNLGNQVGGFLQDDPNVF